MITCLYTLKRGLPLSTFLSVTSPIYFGFLLIFPLVCLCLGFQVQGEKRSLELYKYEEVSIILTGHMGAVLSILSATEFIHNEWLRTTTSLGDRLSCVTVFAFGSPLIGDLSFKRLVEPLKHLNILRIANLPDLIPSGSHKLRCEVAYKESSIDDLM